MEVEFHPQAEEELTEAAAYYERQVSDLGSSFVDEIETAVELLENNPQIGAETESPLRHLPMRRFPHSLIYVIEAARILVVAVAHQRRRPGYWRGKVGR